MLRGVIAGNIEKCRTEAGIWDESEYRLAVIYEDMNGWQLELSDGRFDRESPEFKTIIQGLKQELSRFVNRKGQNPPKNVTAGELALWLMKKKKWYF
jgi:hypothetical protein